MEKGYINVDEREINDITSYLNKNQTNLTNLGDTTKNTFRAMTNTNLFGSGISKISKQVSSVSGSIRRMNDAINKKSHEMLALDDSLAEKAELIDVPQDFVTNNSIRSHIFDGITLNKNDGKNVKDDNTLTETNLAFTDETTHTTMNNIEKEERTFDNIKLREYKDKRKTLGNINNNNQTETNNLNYSEEGITRQNLGTINKINTQTTQNLEYNQAKNINANLRNIKNGNTIDLNLENNPIKNEYFYDDFYE